VINNEKNMAEATWNTCFDVSEKTKDNVKARQDLEILCNRPSLHLYSQNGSGRNQGHHTVLIRLIRPQF